MNVFDTSISGVFWGKPRPATNAFDVWRSLDWDSPYPRFLSRPLSSDPLAPLGALESNWDGYGALAISPEAKGNALHALAMFAGVVSPEITPNPNGTLSFEWEVPSCVAHLEIGKTRFSFYIQPRKGRAVLADGLAQSINRNLASTLQAYLEPAIQRSNTLNRVEIAGAL